MKTMNRFFMFSLLTMVGLVWNSPVALAGELNEPVMADFFYSEGKIYVVLGVIVIILLGLFLYMFSVDKKINKLENELAAKNDGVNKGKV